jgi:NAD(P)-dependent dehydrogenase (short-subunit alcohol dehydrogenase family)
MRFDGRTVIVTGAGSGFGEAIATRFAREGARVVVADVNEENGRRVAAAIAGEGGTARFVRTDVSRSAEVKAMIDLALSAFGGLDVLVNNAGIAGPTGRVEEIAPAEWDRCLAVNITGQFNCARLAVPHLRKSKNASIVNLSSAAGRLGFPMRTPYSASKWAVVGFTKSLAIELGPAGIRVNAIQPGIVEGDRIRRVFEAKAKARGISFEEMQEDALSHVSMRTTITPQQLADAVVFMCSPRGRTISGQAISICGDTQMLS